MSEAAMLQDEYMALDEAENLINELSAEHGATLLKFVLRLTGGDKQWAEDVVQETLVRAWRNADRLRLSEAGTLRPWLVTVARRIVIDARRARAARPAETDDSALERTGIADHSETVVNAITVNRALNTLSASHREILVETYFRDSTVTEAAQRLRLPVGTVKSRVYHALRALRQVLDTKEVTS